MRDHGLTRKYGFEKSTGDLLFFLDSDDWIPENTLNKINNIFLNKEIDILIFNRNVYNGDKIVEFCKPIETNIKEGKIDFDIFLNNTIRGGLGCKVFKKNILNLGMFVNGMNFEDYATTYLYLNKAKTIYYINEVLYNINRDDDNKSLTTKIDIDKIMESVDLMIMVYNKIEKIQLKESICFLLMLLYKMILKEYIKNFLNFKKRKKLKQYLRKLKKIINFNKIEKYCVDFSNWSIYVIKITWIFI